MNRYVNRNNGRAVHNSGNRVAATADSSISRDELVQRRTDEKCVVSNGETGKKWENSFAGKNYFDDLDQLGGSFSCLLSDGIVFLPSFVISYSISLADQNVFCNPVSVVCVST